MDTPHGAGEAPAAVRWLAHAELVVVGAILVASLALTLVSIVERNLGHSTGDWALRLPELMLVWMTFLGMGALVTERGHVAADLFLVHFSPRWQRIANTASIIITAAVLALILAGSLSILRQQIDVGATDQELYDLPVALLLAGLPIGIVLTLGHLAVELFVTWRHE